ncbi:phosphoribosylanthranilate isomerase [Novosphingobium cyanobacteriorum]|uniref:N-(5'-phosphoribosyl)anthranilate isomerase n=1 Tax=Novosphingobium cyanobacteriorum TaxID=3024215 RepID=A0ABT6CJG9_9SPHN|nr:phosphoribosylanthranilate isomerase [Novosphingobium cyanobacteriorum]MDF8333438.1 phosphoribosylanthranilate isomerase [Novosphingobium cyanobacteriorum]
MPAPLIKICGLSTPETLDAAIAAQADYIGLVFFPKSPRNVAIGQAAALAARAAGRTRIVGLFVDPDMALLHEVRATVPLDVIQLHGKEPPAFVQQVRAATGCEAWKALGVRKRADMEAARSYAGAADRILYDAKPPEGAALPGGTGLRIDWDLMKGWKHPLPWMLAGGLDPLNVADAVHVTGAPAVDVSSGVESAPGVKDAGRIAAFVRAVRTI